MKEAIDIKVTFILKSRLEIYTLYLNFIRCSVFFLTPVKMAMHIRMPQLKNSNIRHSR